MSTISRKQFFSITGAALAASAIGFPSILIPKAKEKRGEGGGLNQ